MEPLNREKFNQRLIERVKSVINDYQLFEEGTKVAVALSGGKDSVLTLHLLNDLKNEYDLHLVAITIDEGIKGYREEGLQIARENTRNLGIKLVEKSFWEEYSFDLDDLAGKYKSSCIPCGVFRRHLLNKTAHKLGVDKLATGHNLDDEIQSFLMSFARADFRRFSKFGPKLKQIHPHLIPRIKPLWKIPEKDVGIWAVLNEVPVHFAECPYSYLSLRSKVKNYLNKLEEDRPGTKMAILESFEKSFKKQDAAVELVECERCGEPSSLNVCKACEMLDQMN
ncbi:MAG TPA: TIGR00269 family protein [Methanobacterium sp.]|nr:TIGR00269 family protein [Methanobacterium sp.]